MRRAFLGLATLAIVAVPAFAGPGDDALWFSSHGPIDTSWIVQSPTGSSDYFSQGFGVVAGIGNFESGAGAGSVAGGLLIKGIAVSVSDFGSGATYPVVGVYNPNLGLDASGNTPDLSSAIWQVFSPALTPPSLKNFVTFEAPLAPEAAIPGGATTVNAVAQLPPGSPPLAVGADSSAGSGRAGFTTDGFSTLIVTTSFLDFGLDPGQDNSHTGSCKQSDRKPHGRLRSSNNKLGIGDGDHLTTTVQAGDILNLAFFGNATGDKLRIYFNKSGCSPLTAVGPVLPTATDSDGVGSFIRVNATWPAGFGGSTFQFSAVWGNPACGNPGVGFTNCVTIITTPDPTFTGICDDGTVEFGYVVQIPSGSSDYFNNEFGNGSAQNGIVGFTVSVLDFAGVATYPTSGISNANLGVDATGHTPDIGAPLATLSPFTFPPGTFATTSGLYISHVVAIPGGSLGSHVSAWLQFPPGDSGTLGIGADSSASNGCSFFTLDGYSSPAISFSLNWGIRVKVN